MCGIQEKQHNGIGVTYWPNDLIEYTDTQRKDQPQIESYELPNII